MTEQTVQRAIVKYLRHALPADVWWTAVNPVPSKSKAVAGMSKAMGLRAGAPDFVFCIKGRFVGIEVKAPTGSMSSEQRAARKQITLSGGVFHTVRSLVEVDGIMFALLGDELRARVSA